MTDEPDKTDPSTGERSPADDSAPSPGGGIGKAGESPVPESAPPTATGANVPPLNETPDEKKARLARVIAEAKAKKEAAAQGPGAQMPGTASPATSDAEKAAKIAEAKARAAAMKAAAGEKPAAAAGTPVAPAAGAAAGTIAGTPKPPVKKKEEAPAPKDASGHPLVKALREKFGGAVVEATEFLGQLSVHINRERVVEVCEWLKRDTGTRFDYLCDLTCVHRPDDFDAPFEIVYNLLSISRNARVRLKVSAGETEGVESVTSVWSTANWMEREVYDLFGVTFLNHPDPRRILLPPDWEGHPLRKDYPLEAVENEWTAKHLPEFTGVQGEQLAQRRAYELELLSSPYERRVREVFRGDKEVMPKEHK